jgi:threonine/homoserine/homoserine lactone efflux protein
VELPPEPEPAHQDQPAVWAVVVILIAVLIFDVWALRTHHHTISQWAQRHSKARRVFRWVGVGLLTFLGYHLFWGVFW